MASVANKRMGQTTFEACIRPFVEIPYAILDEDFAACGEVTISSTDRMIPRLGDRFTIESAGQLHDVGVFALTTFQGSWQVTCRADVRGPQ